MSGQGVLLIELSVLVVSLFYLCSFILLRCWFFLLLLFFFFSSRRRHTRSKRDWSSDVCSSDLVSALRRSPARPALAASPGSSASTRLPGSSAQTPPPPAFAIPVRARSPTGCPRGGWRPSTRCRLRCHTARPNPKVLWPSCAALPALPVRCTMHTSSKSRSPFSIRRAATFLPGTRARSVAARTTPRPRSALPSCFLPAPAPRTPGPAIPCRTARKVPPGPSSVLASKESCAAPQFPYSCGRAFASPRSRATRPARSCPARSESPRARPASAASACRAWRQELAPPVLPAPAAACTARVRASRSVAIGTLAHPSASPGPSAPSPIAQTIPASRAHLLLQRQKDRHRRPLASRAHRPSHLAAMPKLSATCPECLYLSR